MFQSTRELIQTCDLRITGLKTNHGQHFYRKLNLLFRIFLLLFVQHLSLLYNFRRNLKGCKIWTKKMRCRIKSFLFDLLNGRWLSIKKVVRNKTFSYFHETIFRRLFKSKNILLHYYSLSHIFTAWNFCSN
jgi:hypothetical protein